LNPASAHLEFDGVSWPVPSPPGMKEIEMPQSADKVIDHEMLFREPEYQKLFADKKAFEYNHADVKIEEIRDWTKTRDYMEKNFARDSLVVNPAKACQPLGAVYVANGSTRP